MPPSASGAPTSSARLPAHPVQVDVGELEERRRARDVQGGALPVPPDRQDGGRRLDSALAAQPAGVDAVPGHRGDDHVTEQVVADRADREHAGAELGQVDARAGRRPGRRGPDLGEPGAALAGRDGLDRPAEHVQNVGSEHGHRAQRPYRRGGRSLGGAGSPVMGAVPFASRSGAAGSRPPPRRVRPPTAPRVPRTPARAGRCGPATQAAAPGHRPAPGRRRR